jgi:hypothetical protein
MSFKSTSIEFRPVCALKRSVMEKVTFAIKRISFDANASHSPGPEHPASKQFVRPRENPKFRVIPSASTSWFPLSQHQPLVVHDLAVLNFPMMLPD